MRVMKSIDVPAYVADEFNSPLGHPSKNPNAVDLSLLRVYKLINEALKNINAFDWEVDSRRYHSLLANEPYGIERVGDKFYIYAEERGTRSAVAIFKSSNMAAKYFVWLVSKGQAKIDWTLFLDMEP
jgi:hypothetical protein